MQSLKTYFDHFKSDGTVFGSVSKRGFVTIPFLIPSPRMVENFESMAFSIDQHIEINEKQIRTLATVRDTLLPKLISGEVWIEEATRKVEAAL
jgi:type I restriction enzyme S subunit